MRSKERKWRGGTPLFAFEEHGRVGRSEYKRGFRDLLLRREIHARPVAGSAVASLIVSRRICDKGRRRLCRMVDRPTMRPATELRIAAIMPEGAG